MSNAPEDLDHEFKGCTIVAIVFACVLGLIAIGIYMWR